MSDTLDEHAQHRRPHSQPMAAAYLEFDLARERAGQLERLQNPIVERAMDFELERAKRVADPFEIIALPVSEIVGRIDAPFLAGLMMRRVSNAI